MASDKNWAQAYVNDPLTAPSPAAETGPGSSFRPDRIDSKQASTTTTTMNTQNTGSSLASNNPFRDSASSPKKAPKVHSRNVSSGSHHGFPDLPASGPAAHREAVSAALRGSSGGSPRRSLDQDYRRSLDEIEGRPRRSSSLRGRFPGDTSHHPLAQLNKEHRKAGRSPHLRKKHHHGRDSIDKLDDGGLGMTYHHEGPYDAASLARNNSFESSPIAALKQSNAEALKATQREKVQDSIEKHRPLDGVAVHAPGTVDELGRPMEYEEGTDMMRDPTAPGGAYRRYDDLEYDGDDLEGKGKPVRPQGKDFWEWEKARKGGKIARDGGHGEAVELSEGANAGLLGSSKSGRVEEAELGEASGSGTGHGHGAIEGLKKRMGSLKLKGRHGAD